MKTTTTSNDNTTTPTPTVTLTSDAESLKIRTSQWALQDIDDREDWQEDFALALLKKQNPKKKNDPMLAFGNPFRNLRTGFSVAFRCFEVRPDFSFRHRARFNIDGFLALDESMGSTCPDYWWAHYFSKEFMRASVILNKAGILESRDLGPDPEVPECSISGIRLRTDKVIQLLKESNPEKYTGLKS